MLINYLSSKKLRNRAMNKKETIEEEIQKTLDLIEQGETIPPDPYFYSKIMNRIEQKNRKRSLYHSILKPAFWIFLFLINIGSAIWYLSGSGSDSRIEMRKNAVEILAEDFGLNSGQSNQLRFE